MEESTVQCTLYKLIKVLHFLNFVTFSNRDEDKILFQQRVPSLCPVPQFTVFPSHPPPPSPPPPPRVPRVYCIEEHCPPPTHSRLLINSKLFLFSNSTYICILQSSGYELIFLIIFKDAFQHFFPRGFPLSNLSGPLILALVSNSLQITVLTSQTYRVGLCVVKRSEKLEFQCGRRRVKGTRISLKEHPGKQVLQVLK